MSLTTISYRSGWFEGPVTELGGDDREDVAVLFLHLLYADGAPITKARAL